MDFAADADLERWMEAHRIKPAASYVNWVGRTVVQVREEARLRALLREALPKVEAREPQAMLEAPARRGRTPCRADAASPRPRPRGATPTWFTCSRRLSSPSRSSCSFPWRPSSSQSSA